MSFTITHPKGSYKMRIDKLVREFTALPAVEVKQEAPAETTTETIELDKLTNSDTSVRREFCPY